MAYLDKTHPQLSHRIQCELLSVSRSSTYYKAKDKNQSDIDVLNAIRSIWEACPFYGARRIQATLERNGTHLNLKKVRRLMKIGGIEALHPGPKTSVKGRENRRYPYVLKNLSVTEANQVWATDITYIKLPQGYAYLVALIDVYSRYILSWRLSNSLSTFFCLEALNEALSLYKKPDIFNTDQGAQFTSDEWIYTLVNWGIRPSMTGVGRCLDNIYSERFWRTLKYENAYIYGYESMRDARQKIGNFIKFYNLERPHQSLGYKTPEEIYKSLFWEKSRPDGYVDSSQYLGVDLSTSPQAVFNNQTIGGQISLI